jgi:hypothetical protein
MFIELLAIPGRVRRHRTMDIDRKGQHRASA